MISWPMKNERDTKQLCVASHFVRFELYFGIVLRVTNPSLSFGSIASSMYLARADACLHLGKCCSLKFKTGKVCEAIAGMLGCLSSEASQKEWYERKTFH